MSLRRLENVIQRDWLAPLGGMTLACPAPRMAVAQGHGGNGGGEEHVILAQLTPVA